MSKLTNKSRKPTKQNNAPDNITLNQQNIYHMGASEIDAITRMQDKHPELVQDILNLRKTELEHQSQIISIEKVEQNLRIEHAPSIRRFAFLGQAMAFFLSLACICGGAYFGYIGNSIVAGLFLTSSISVAFAQFYKKGDKQQ